MIPLVELDWFSPAAGPAHGLPETLTVAPGVIYARDTFQCWRGSTDSAGPHVGFILQVHFFLDDLFPKTIDKPIFQ